VDTINGIDVRRRLLAPTSHARVRTFVTFRDLSTPVARAGSSPQLPLVRSMSTRWRAEAALAVLFAAVR